MMIILSLYEYDMHMFKLSWGVNNLLRRSRHYAVTGILTYGVDVHPSCKFSFAYVDMRKMWPTN